MTFVLVHGGVHGGWCWSRVAPLLRAAGHEVFTPTLTGLGERYHLSGPSVDVQTHVEDVVAVLECEELTDVVLVAHSYGGCPATGAVDRVPSRIASVVYLDAIVGRDGRAQFDDVPAETVEMKLALGVDVNGGKSLQGAPPEWYGVTAPDDVAWLTRRLTPQPVGTYTSALVLDNPPGNGRPCTFIRCTSPRLAAIDESEAYARSLGMPIMEIATGHDAMVTAPDELASLLLQAAAG